jgi:D-alanyl-D-alanine carboxypeptidase/D-alanyl-D-alanine-endopeptidase (penicillin-binding protein 4)
MQGLSKLGIAFDGECKAGTPPKDALMLSSRIHRFNDVLVPMMKESDNLYAESMFYHIGASMGVRPAKASHARQLIKKEIAKAGVSGVQYRIADGSGLSLYNYVTPEILVKMLVYAYRQTKINYHLFSALPIAGQDGTLKKRMKDTPAQINIHAKTGTLTGISSLAGYAIAANNHILAFSIINQGVMKNEQGRNFQDKVCAALCK